MTDRAYLHRIWEKMVRENASFNIIYRWNPNVTDQASNNFYFDMYQGFKRGMKLGTRSAHGFHGPRDCYWILKKQPKLPKPMTISTDTQLDS